jgi:hypothetical protein
VRTILARGAAALVLLAALGATTIPAAAAATRPDGVQPSSSISGGLGAVAAISSSNAWAVGSTGSNGALIMRWNGASWSQVSAHAPSSSFLNGVAGTSATNAWAVGGTGAGKPLILRWNGSRWTRISPHLPSGTYLSAVAAASAHSVWIVGTRDASNPRTLIMHWNGTTWKQEKSPNPKAGRNNGDVLSAVSVVSNGDVFASGARTVRYGGPAGGLILHWNGSTWRQASATAVTGKVSGVTGIAATSRSSAFAAGCPCAGGPDGAVIGHWNGRSWVKQHVPVRSLDTSLESIAATSRSSAWAAGEYCKARCTGGTENPEYLPLLLRWNGRAWKLSAAQVTRSSNVNGLAALSASSAWAVGSSNGKILILHWNGSSWKLSS